MAKYSIPGFEADQYDQAVRSFGDEAALWTFIKDSVVDEAQLRLATELKAQANVAVREGTKALREKLPARTAPKKNQARYEALTAEAAARNSKPTRG